MILERISKSSGHERGSGEQRRPTWKNHEYQSSVRGTSSPPPPVPTTLRRSPFWLARIAIPRVKGDASMTWYLPDKGRVNRKRKEKGASVRMSCVYHTSIGLGARRCRTYGNLPGMKIRLIPSQKIRKISCPSISRSISTNSESFLTDLLAQLLLYHPRGFQPGEQVQKCQQDPGNYRDPGCGGLWPIASDARCSVRLAKRFLFEQAHPGDKRGGARYSTSSDNIELRASRRERKKGKGWLRSAHILCRIRHPTALQITNHDVLSATNHPSVLISRDAD